METIIYPEWIKTFSEIKDLKEWKRCAKMIFKFNNPKKLTLMQIQHSLAKIHGFENYKELKEYFEEEKNGKN